VYLKPEEREDPLQNAKVFFRDVNVSLHWGFYEPSSSMIFFCCFFLFKDLNINFCTTNQELIKNVDAIVLSVKPTDIKSLLKDISNHLSEKHLILSIVAGVKLDDLHQV
jgi:hypothetical protein